MFRKRYSQATWAFGNTSSIRGCLVTISEACERRGQPCVRVDACEFAVLDQRDDHRLVFAAVVVAG